MSDFGRNLRLLRGPLSQETFAKKVEISRSTINKLENGKRKPTQRHLSKLTEHTGVDADVIQGPHAKFRDIMKEEEIKTNLILLSFRSTRKNISRSSPIFKNYSGQYTVYYRQTQETAPHEEKKIVVSLLTVSRMTREGIEFKFWNPYKEATGDWAVFDYTGLMYPVGDFLYFLGEQGENDYEILSIVISVSPSPRVSALRGIILGIGVLDGRKCIAARPIVALRRQKIVDDWREVLLKEIGYLPEGRIPKIVRDELSTEKITIF